MLKFDPASGDTTVFPGNQATTATAITVDAEGTISPPVNTRDMRSGRLEHDGTHHVLVDSFEGKQKLNSPNDLCIKSDGFDLVSLTRPYGILSGPRRANARESELDGKLRFTDLSQRREISPP